jgi:hypothetical protein
MTTFIARFVAREGRTHKNDWAKISVGLNTWAPERIEADEIVDFAVEAPNQTEAENFVSGAVGHGRFKILAPRHPMHAEEARRNLLEYDRGPLYREAEALRSLPSESNPAEEG